MIHHGANHNIRSAVMLGAGNVACALGECLSGKGIRISQVYNRSSESGRYLADRLNAGYTGSLNQLDQTADLYIIAVSDDAIDQIARASRFPEAALVVHTAGAVDMEVLHDVSHYGVLYPLQTFTRNRLVDFNAIPLLIEANNDQNLERLRNFASLISSHVHEMSSADRVVMHLAAVISSNFTNHMLTLSDKVLKNNNLPSGLLHTLMSETVNKAFEMGPSRAQTGPASRGNLKVIARHLDMLETLPDIKNIYRILTESIMNMNKA